MKRYSLLFGNTNGLNGVQKDLTDFKNFLMSNIGGEWKNEEICLKENVTRMWLEKSMAKFRAMNLDYLIVYFSGHGGQRRNEDYIVLNENKERFCISELERLAERQLNIYDCCRAIDEDEMQKSMENFSHIKESCKRSTLRAAYEKRIMQSAPQQMTLYSCSNDECSIDESKGGLYTQNFLKSARYITNKEKRVIEAHCEAVFEVLNHSKGQQNPEYMMYKLPPERQLIISIGSQIIYG